VRFRISVPVSCKYVLFFWSGFLSFTVSLFWSLFFTWFFLAALFFLFRQSQVRPYSRNWAVVQTTEESGFDTRQDQNISLLPTAFKQFIGTAQLPTKDVQTASSPEIKRSGRECDYTFPSSAEVKTEWISTLTPPYMYIVIVSCMIEQRASTSDLPSTFLVSRSTLLLSV